MCRLAVIWINVFFPVLIWSGLAPKDYVVWILEVAPAIIAVLVLGATYKTYPLTPLVYTLILAYCVILMIGVHYTYVEVPLGEWFRDF